MFAACNKSSSEQEAIANTLAGTWVYTEQYSSNGGPGQWSAVTPANQYISFGADSTLRSNIAGFHNATYSLVDSNKVKVTHPQINSSGYTTFQFAIDTVKHELILSPVAPYLCIEGCAMRFKKTTAKD
jgi:hypothetical protein